MRRRAQSGFLDEQRLTEIVALLLSLTIEAVVAAAVARLAGWGDPLRATAAASLATLVTHALAWPGVSVLEDRLGYLPAVLVVEAIVVATESIAYRLIVPLGLSRALRLSLIANAASAGAGLGFYALSLG